MQDNHHQMCTSIAHQSLTVHQDTCLLVIDALTALVHWYSAPMVQPLLACCLVINLRADTFRLTSDGKRTGSKNCVQGERKKIVPAQLEEMMRQFIVR